MQIVTLSSGHGRARVSTYGAQVLDARLDGRDLLWLSPMAAATAAGAAIRGGVPLCFPWFGKHPDGLPQHGFARTRDWQLIDQRPTSATFALTDDADTRALWPHAFRAELTVSIDDALHFTFEVTNTGTEPAALTYALHSYFARPAATATVAELGVGFASPIDEVHADVPDLLHLDDIAITAHGMPDAIVWNPGANDIADIAAGWRDFVCVERGRVGANTVTLSAGAQHAATLRLGFV